jgi:hypothetical protein
MQSWKALAGLSVLLIAAANSSAYAGAVCTSWLHLQAGSKDMNLYDPRAREECVRDIERQTQQAGYRSSVNVDTLFFWFEEDVVTVRCMSRTLVAMSAYDSRTRDACPLLDQIKNALREQR